MFGRLSIKSGNSTFKSKILAYPNFALASCAQLGVFQMPSLNIQFNHTIGSSAKIDKSFEISFRIPFFYDQIIKQPKSIYFGLSVHTHCRNRISRVDSLPMQWRHGGNCSLCTQDQQDRVCYIMYFFIMLLLVHYFTWIWFELHRTV